MTELLLDYDGALPKRLLDRICRIAKLVGRRVHAVRYNKTKHGWHVLVVVSGRLEPLAVVCWQLILGSDVNRELFNFKRASGLDGTPVFWRKRHRWNTFYARKDER